MAKNAECERKKTCTQVLSEAGVGEGKNLPLVAATLGGRAQEAEVS